MNRVSLGLLSSSISTQFKTRTLSITPNHSLSKFKHPITILITILLVLGHSTPAALFYKSFNFQGSDRQLSTLGNSLFFHNNKTTLFVVKDYTADYGHLGFDILPDGVNGDLGPIVASSQPENKVFIATGASAIICFDLKDNTSYKIWYQHQYLRKFYLTRAVMISSTNYLLGISHVIEEAAFIDVSKTSNAGFFIKVGESPLKEIELNSRFGLLMTEDGSTLHQISLATKSVIGTTGYFGSPGYALYKLSYFSLFPEADLFFGAVGDGQISSDIFMFDGKLNESGKLKSFGALYFKTRLFLYLKQTNTLFVSDGKRSNFINVLTGAIDDVTISDRSDVTLTQISMIDNSSYLAILTSSSLTQTVSLYKFNGGVACHANCEDCDIGISESGCSLCFHGYTMNNGKCEKPNCPAGQFYNIITRTCEVASSTINIISPYTTKRLPQGCAKVSLYGGRCIECESSLNSMASMDKSCTQDTVCQHGTYSYNSTTCYNCHDTCSSCSGKEPSMCYSCQYGFAKKSDSSSGSVCDSNCLPGYFYSSRDEKCNLCYAYCETCLAQDDLKCTRCSKGFYLNGGYCHYLCPDGFVPNDQTRKCEICTSTNCSPCSGSLLIYKNLCFNKCPPSTGTYDNNQCFDCWDANCIMLILSNKTVVRATDGSVIDVTKLNKDEDKMKVTKTVVIVVISILSIVVCVLIIIALYCFNKSGGSSNLSKSSLAPNEPPFFNERAEVQDTESGQDTPDQPNKLNLHGRTDSTTRLTANRNIPISLDEKADQSVAKSKNRSHQVLFKQSNPEDSIKLQKQK